MDPIANLITGTDFLLFFIYAIFGFLLMRYLVFRDVSIVSSPLLFWVYFIKLAGCALMCYLIVNYWKNGDAINYFTDGKALGELIKQDVANVRYLFLSAADFQEKVNSDNYTTVSSIVVGENNFVVSKFAAVFYLLSAGKFLIVNFFFCLFATIGEFFLFIALSKKYPSFKKQIAIGALLMPSVLLYSSFMVKETLAMGLMGIIFYSLFQFFRKKRIVWHLIVIVIGGLVILWVKPYIIYAILMAVLFSLLIRLIVYLMKKNIIIKGITILSLLVAGYLFYKNMNAFNGYVVDFVDTANFFQNQYNSDFGETSSFSIGDIDPTVKGFIQKAPSGFFTTYFRPYIWEVDKPIILFSALESFAVLLLFFVVVFRNLLYIPKLFRSDFFILYAFVFVIVFGVIVGLTTFNFGTLIRYKIPAIPFLMLFIFHLKNQSFKRKDKEIQAVIP